MRPVPGLPPRVPVITRGLALLAAILVSIAGCFAELDWRELAPPEGRFVVLMPAKVHLESRPLADGVTMHLWSARAADSLFGVGYADYPAPDKDLLERTAQALARNIGGSVVRSRDIRLDAATGREIVAEGSAGGAPAQLDARLLLAGTRLYQVVLISPRGRLAAADVEMFLGSFSMKN